MFSYYQPGSTAFIDLISTGNAFWKAAISGSTISPINEMPWPFNPQAVQPYLFKILSKAWIRSVLVTSFLKVTLIELPILILFYAYSLIGFSAYSVTFISIVINGELEGYNDIKFRIYYLLKYPCFNGVYVVF
ncbi:hypothetical protein BEL04_19485 [Mucilaginibacter sp. PPCGB 2223]|nr:hypothetical protein BEL04_19485 [Mucilaginibacter sp. PPCGB 2223]